MGVCWDDEGKIRKCKQLGTVVQAERETSEKKLRTNTVVANFLQIITPVPSLSQQPNGDRIFGS